MLIAVLAIPFVMQPRRARPPADARRLIIVSPHNEAIRHEFEHAFRAWHRAQYHQEVVIDWRNIGGTSEIARYLDSEFTAADRIGRSGIGIDIFFGGGQFDHVRQAGRGQLAPAGVRERHPDRLTDAVIPQYVSGETLYDTDDLWYGACLSSFGICYNTDGLTAAGIELPPRRWSDLANPALRQRVALADPSKSGSINKAFEMLIQQQIADAMLESGYDPDTDDIAALETAWPIALDMVRRISANARYFTDSASKVTLDVAQGNAAAGMSIDFYGRFQAETVSRNEGSDRMRYITPVGGSSVSADPVSILRGAPDRQLAERFIDFVLSVDGQRLWNYRVGAPGGPVRYALRRLPIRRDLYTQADRVHMSDGEVNPYATADRFTYRPQWTGPLFHLIRLLIRAMCLDTHQELTAAWQAIQKYGGPDAQPAAMAIWRELPANAGYAAALELAAGPLRDKVHEVQITREWSIFFRDRYRKIRRLVETQSESR